MKVVNVSPHVLMDLHSCETKAWTRHVKGFTSRGDAIKMIAGQGFHKAMEVLLDPVAQEHQPREYAAVAALHATYDDAFLRLAPEKLEPSLTPQNLDRVLQRWIQMHPPAMLPWVRVLAVEEAFVSRTWTLGDVQVNLIVRPDIVVEDRAGKIRWVDTKTTGWHISDDSWKLALRLSLQTQLYSDAIVQKYGAEKAIYGGWVNAIELRQLPSDPKRKCATHKVVYAECGNEHAKAEFIECLTTEAKVAAAARDAEAAAEQFALHTTLVADVTQLNVHGTSNNTCRFCPAADFCDSGRPVDALENFMVYEPYPVEVGRRA